MPEFLVLPQGISTAPYIFSRFTLAITSYLPPVVGPQMLALGPSSRGSELCIPLVARRSLLTSLPVPSSAVRWCGREPPDRPRCGPACPEKGYGRFGPPARTAGLPGHLFYRPPVPSSGTPVGSNGLIHWSFPRRTHSLSVAPLDRALAGLAPLISAWIAPTLTATACCKLVCVAIAPCCNVSKYSCVRRSAFRAITA